MKRIRNVFNRHIREKKKTRLIQSTDINPIRVMMVSSEIKSVLSSYKNMNSVLST